LTRPSGEQSMETKLQLIAARAVSFVKSRVRENRQHGSVRGRVPESQSREALGKTHAFKLALALLDRFLA